MQNWDGGAVMTCDESAEYDTGDCTRFTEAGDEWKFAGLVALSLSRSGWKTAEEAGRNAFQCVVGANSPYASLANPLAPEGIWLTPDEDAGLLIVMECIVDGCAAVHDRRGALAKGDRPKWDEAAARRGIAAVRQHLGDMAVEADALDKLVRPMAGAEGVGAQTHQHRRHRRDRCRRHGRSSFTTLSVLSCRTRHGKRGSTHGVTPVSHRLSLSAKNCHEQRYP